MKKLVLLLPVFLAVALAGCQNGSAPAAKTDEPTSSTTPDTTANTSEPAPAPRKSDATDVGPELRTAAYDYYGLGCQDDLVYDMQNQGMFEEGKQIVNYQGLKDGVPTYVVSRTGSLSQIGDETVQLTKEGVMLTEATVGKLDKPELALPADIAVGKTWSETRKFSRNDGKVLEMSTNNKVDKEEKLKVPAGEFDCLHVVTTGTIKTDGKTNAYTADAYYAKGIGTVKLTLETSDGSQKNTIVVTLKEIKKAGSASTDKPKE